MDYDTFFSSQRWTILEIIARAPRSPVEISQILGTSVSYVSQQLKLLEAAGLVAKERTGSAEKGKPRMLYSISREIAHVSLLTRGQPAKKHFILDDHHKIILNIWMLDSSFHKDIERLYWHLEAEISEIEGIFLDVASSRKELFILSSSKNVKARAENFIKNLGTFKVTFATPEIIQKKPAVNLHAIHDPHFLLLDKNVKGGNIEKDEKQN